MEYTLFVMPLVLFFGIAGAQPVTFGLLPANPHVQRPPLCPDILCTLEIIPDECAEVPVIQKNGIICSECPKWKDMCTNTQNRFQNPEPDVNIQPEVACPILSCNVGSIPKGCDYIETYDYLGRKCQKCPVRRTGCVVPVGNSNAPQVACPIQACTLSFIPPECVEAQQFDFIGRTCESCPKWRTGCTPGNPKINNIAPSILPEMACPLLQCDSFVPNECSIFPEYQFRNKMCQGCPVWRDGCREQERLNNNINPSDNSRAVLPKRCPTFPCAAILIPEECKEEQPFDFQGTICYRCPRWRTGCQPSNLNSNTQNNVPQVACPLLQCHTPNVPRQCLQEEFVQFGGRTCNECPSVKLECQGMIPPRPIASVSASDLTMQSDIACPMVKCPLIFIPSECEEFETFQIQGKTCKGCPRYRDGCIPKMDGAVPDTSNTFPQIPAKVDNVACPLIKCPLIEIPSECKEEQPYHFEGKTCSGCPKWKAGCTPNSIAIPLQSLSEITPPKPDISCPLVKCSRMYIPAECVDKQAYVFQGKTCFQCPAWKSGCVPQQGQDLGTPEVACPVQTCQTMQISPECEEKQTFQYHGKTCFGCPKWRAGCDPAPVQRSGVPEIACPLQVCTTQFIPVECEEQQPFQFNGKTCFNCPKRKEGCLSNSVNDRNQTTSTPNVVAPEVACPLHECTDIPHECIQEQQYQFNGKTCFKCPTWRRGCSAKVPISSVDHHNRASPHTPTVSCPLLDCSSSQIPDECKQEVPYTFLGIKTCYRCPILRSGCTPNNNTPVVNQLELNTNIIVPVSSSKLTDLKEIIPVSQLTALINTITCPPLPCPDFQIPIQCREYTKYEYQGRSCQGCHTWRVGCNVVLDTPAYYNTNGMMAFNLFNDLTNRVHMPGRK